MDTAHRGQGPWAPTICKPVGSLNAIHPFCKLLPGIVVFHQHSPASFPGYYFPHEFSFWLPCSKQVFLCHSYFCLLFPWKTSSLKRHGFSLPKFIKCLYKIAHSFTVVIVGFLFYFIMIYFETIGFQGQIISGTIIEEECCLLNYGKHVKTWKICLRIDEIHYFSFCTLSLSFFSSGMSLYDLGCYVLSTSLPLKFPAATNTW